MKILITSGGTKIPIDTVRDITNMSTGTFGTKIAESLLYAGHEIAFFRAKNSKSPMRVTLDYNKNHSFKSSDSDIFDTDEFWRWTERRERWAERYKEMEFSTFEQYERGLSIFIGCEHPDVIVLAAAVSDYTVEKPFNGKIRSNDMLTIRLTSLPKIINKVKGWAPYAKLVGFKLLVGSMSDTLVEAAKKSCVENGCDMVVANDLEDIKEGKHKLTIVEPTLGGHRINVFHSDPKDSNYLAKVVAERITKL